jgi:hypothetical protein
MESPLRQDLEQLRSTYVVLKPSARLAMVRQRLAKSEGESAATRLVATLAAVEALARSLVVHAPHRPPATAPIRYQQMRTTGALELVEEALKVYGSPPAVDVFGAQDWDRFEIATLYRDTLVHECTAPAADKYPMLVESAERVLETLVKVGGLLRVVS